MFNRLIEAFMPQAAGKVSESTLETTVSGAGHLAGWHPDAARATGWGKTLLRQHCLLSMQVAHFVIMSTSLLASSSKRRRQQSAGWCFALRCVWLIAILSMHEVSGTRMILA